MAGQSVTEAQNGGSVSLGVGEVLSVELQGIASAGYVWEPSRVPAFLEQTDKLSGPVNARQRQPGFAGGNNWDVHVFRATAAGEGELVLGLVRPWETGKAPTRTFSVRVTVR
jgi:predicted secreted protein